VTQVVFDASEIDALGRAFLRLPGEIKAKAMASAMRRMRDMARTQVVRLDAKRVKIPVGKVRERTTAYFNAGGNTIEVVEKSGWIRLYELDARQTGKGVSVKLRGSYKHAFIASMRSGHTGAMQRYEPTMRKRPRKGEFGPPSPDDVVYKRLKIREMFGPNPAHDITNNPDDYLQLMATLIEDNLLPRVIHEIDRLLPR